MSGTEGDLSGRVADRGPTVVLLRTGRVAAEVTAERLQELGIEALIDDLPNVFVRLTSGGNYRVRIVVPEADLARAQQAVERWAVEAEPRVRGLAREVQLVLGGLTLVALGLAGLLLWLRVPHALWWGSGAWIAGTAGWIWRSRRQLSGAAGSPEASRT